MSLVKKQFYAICVEKTKISTIPKNLKNDLQLEIGTLIKVLKSSNNKNENCIIHVFNSESEKFDNDIFLCSIESISPITGQLWNILIGIKNLNGRLIVARNEYQILNYKLGMKVQINFEFIDEKKLVDCTIEYIGEVPEFNSTGIFFGCMISVNYLLFCL